MDALRLFPIFRIGRHVAMSGLAVTFSDPELQATAAGYQPTRKAAPLVLGHPQDESRETHFGRVAKLIVRDGVLYALAAVSDVLVNLVRDGRYRYVSASFATPDASSNPTPGAYYLRHVGILGAMPPAVKGLGPLAFAEAEAARVVFASDVPGLTFADMDGFHSPEGYGTDQHRLAIHQSAVAMQRTCPALSYGEAASMAECFADF